VKCHVLVAFWSIRHDTQVVMLVAEQKKRGLILVKQRQENNKRGRASTPQRMTREESGLCFLAKLAAMAAVEDVDDEAEGQPDHEAQPGDDGESGHEAAA
jgi:hypothetical protein